MSEHENNLETEVIDTDVDVSEVEVEEVDVVDPQEIDNEDDKVAQFKKNLEEKDLEAKGYLDRLQRTMAEFDNFRKRTAKEKTAMYENGVKETVEAILPIIDNFERALSTSNVGEETNSFVQGVEMIYKQFKSALEGIGVKEIEAVGKEFDPNFHNAVTHVEDENFGDNEVVEQFQKGYMYNDLVIRYSMVKVAN